MEEFRGKRISGTIISFDTTTYRGRVWVNCKSHEFHVSSYNSRLFRMPRRGDIVEAVFVRGELVEVCAKD
jgi:hypothetical protein